MKLQIFKTMWGATGTISDAIDQLLSAGMNGIEAQAPKSIPQQRELSELLQKNRVLYIAEITTAGSYVPDRKASLQQHLDSLEIKLNHCTDLNPLFVSCLGGCDAWPENQSIEFFQRAIELAARYDLKISFETHRSRSLFNPWVSQRIVEQLPEILLTVDFSHWCVVCERLMDTELEVIHAIADNVQHIHARVGYDQGPQVPDPRAPEYQYALRAHQRWWEIIWRSQQARGLTNTTMTPEFGPDGYLHEAPFSRKPVADLWDINQWMAKEELNHFKQFIT
ncbi:MAG: TIM barrel protein [Gammaproteobacteria bacterium]|nr:TIM barrel protein [Gammaproteobacteria bacterium]